jgi:hypothetical protein
MHAVGATVSLFAMLLLLAFEADGVKPRVTVLRLK